MQPPRPERDGKDNSINPNPFDQLRGVAPANGCNAP
jgi:hypothetical protein